MFAKKMMDEAFEISASSMGEDFLSPVLSLQKNGAVKI